MEVAILHDTIRFQSPSPLVSARLVMPGEDSTCIVRDFGFWIFASWCLVPRHRPDVFKECDGQALESQRHECSKRQAAPHSLAKSPPYERCEEGFATTITIFFAHLAVFEHSLPMQPGNVANNCHQRLFVTTAPPHLRLHSASAPSVGDRCD